MNDLAHGTQAVMLLSALMGIWMWAAWARRNRSMALYAVAPITWLAHVAVFYLVFFVSRDNPAIPFGLWSAIVQMHGAFLVIGIGAGLWFEQVNLVRKGPIL